ncbi:18764_t:CDS:2, partial [Racocetra persica]
MSDVNSMTNSSAASEILERLDAEIILIKQGKNINDGLIVIRNITQEIFDYHNKMFELKEHEITIHKSLTYEYYQEAQFFRYYLYKDLMETIIWWYIILLDKVVDYVLNIKIVKKIVEEIKKKISGWVLHIIQTQDNSRSKGVFRSYFDVYEDSGSGEKIVIEVSGDDNVRKKIISYLRSGKIDYNYQIESNFFTSEKIKHNEIIHIWEEYGNEDNKLKFKLMKSSKKNGEDVNYGSLKGRVVLKSTDNEAIEKIKGHPEELAAAIFSKSH